MPENVEPVRADDHVVPVRIRAAHWKTLVRGGLHVTGRLQLVKQPDGVYALREKA